MNLHLAQKYIIKNKPVMTVSFFVGTLSVCGMKNSNNIAKANE